MVQVKSEEWGGLWVDLREEEQMVDKSVLKAILCQVCSTCYLSTMELVYNYTQYTHTMTLLIDEYEYL